MWSKIMGSADGCYLYNSYPLWYFDEDGIEDYGGFEGFAGWKKPNAKQYAA
jgi:hypothetical protein